jgi:hypothetical protein
MPHGANGVAIDSVGNVLVAGTEGRNDEGDNAWVRKLDPDGLELWTRTTNWTAIPSQWHYDSWLRKLTMNGDELWTRRHGARALTRDPHRRGAKSILPDPSSNCTRSTSTP